MSARVDVDAAPRPRGRTRWVICGLLFAANVGAVVTPFLVSFIVARMLFDWRWAFIVTGLFNLIWIAAWRRLYHPPAGHPRLTCAERDSIEAEPAVDTGRAGERAMFASALFALPVMFAAQAGSIGVAVLLIGVACAAHQGFSTDLFALPGDQFPRYAQETLIGLGGFAGACGGFTASKSLGLLLDTVGSYAPFFIACGMAYLVALLVFHLLNPRSRSVTPGSAG